MKKNNIIHAIYAILWLNIWIASVDWGVTILRALVAIRNVNIFILYILITTSAIVGAKGFLRNIAKAVLLDGKEKRSDCDDKNI